MKTTAIYLKNKVTGLRQKLPASATKLAAGLRENGWEETEPFEEPRKRQRRAKDYYFTPNFQGW